MRKTLNYGKICLLATLMMGVILSFNSCEVAEDIVGNVTVAKLEGEWSCDETSSIYKKATSSVYSVYISADADDANGVIIDDFYGFLSINASVSAFSISIPEQTAGDGFTVKGTGVISSNYSKITWSYTVDDGGDIDNVTAVYTKVD